MRYASIDELKTRLGITDATDDTILGMVLDSVSLLIEKKTHRRFWKNTSDETRYYSPMQSDALFTDDIVSVTTLKSDEDQDRTYEATWATTDYDLCPYNAATLSPQEPYTWLEITPQGSYSFPTGQKAVQIVGVFGWPEVPATVKEATLIQAARIFKRKDSPFGIAGVGEFGQVQLLGKLDPDVESFLEPLTRVV